MTSWRNAFDFYGVRQLTALIIAFPATWLGHRLLIGSAPDNWTMWPDAAKAAVRSTSAGLYGAAVILWMWALTWPFAVRFRSWAALRIAAAAMALVSGPSVWKLLSGLANLCFRSGDYFGDAAWTLGRIAVLPLMFGIAVAGWPLVSERFHANPTMRRLFVRGAASGFAGPVALKRYAGAPPRRGKGGVVLTEGFVVGRVGAEDAYAGGRTVTIDNSAHVAVYGMPGAGKFLLAGCTLATSVASKIVISTKPELADSFLAFAADPRLLPPAGSTPRAGRFGVDPRPLSNVAQFLPGSTAHLVDPSGESVHPTGSHCLVSDVDPHADDARVWALTVTGTSFVRPEHSATDKWFSDAPKGFAAAVWLYFRVSDRDPTHWYLPYVFERAMGSDPASGRADAQAFATLLQGMQNCNHPVHGAFIRTKGVEIAELGDRAYGALKSEIITNCSWVFDPVFRRQLERPSTFSYREVGDDEHPTSVFVVPLRGTMGLQTSMAWIRAHAALAITSATLRKDRPRVPTMIFLDECRQYLSGSNGEGVPEFSRGLTLLREARCRLVTFWQSAPSARHTLGDRVAEELDATSASVYFGIDCVETAERISRRLGKTQLRTGEVVDVKSPSEILRELRINSPLCYLMGGGLPPMKLHRASFKAVSTKDGLVLPGFGIEGQYDELSKYTYGGRP